MIRKIDNLEIIELNNKKICKKKCNSNIISKYKYLNTKDFHNYIDTKVIDGYEIRDYIDEINISNDDKLNELMYTIIMLHTKTTHFKSISLTEIKILYEKATDELVELKEYYNKIFDDNVIYLYLKPSISLLINKISIILIAIDNSKFFLDKWYEIIKNKQRKRVVMNHNNLKLSNFIVSDKSYLINFNKSIIDYSIYDLLSLFKNNYETIDMSDLFDLYISKYNLYLEEKYLLFSLLLKIDKIDFNDNEIINTRKVERVINYLEKISVFLEYCMKTKK